MSNSKRWICVTQSQFREDLKFWVKTDRKIALRILDLVEASLRDPFNGKGKPEALRGISGNVWSRRITQKDRLVYRVFEDKVDFLQARYHY